MREGVGPDAHAPRRGIGHGGETREEQPPERLLRDGGNAAEPVGLESIGGDRGRSRAASDVVEEFEGLAAEAATELVGDDLDLVTLVRGDSVPRRVLVGLNLVRGRAEPGRFVASR